MIFVDKGAWFASVAPSDVNHDAGRRWLEGNQDVLLTTDFVIDETLTLLGIRGMATAATAIGELFMSDQLAEIVMIAEEDFKQAWHVFRRFTDKEWSFTDCISKVVMGWPGIARAFSFDHHFLQFGDIVVVP